jgi:hypothetical protein
MLMGLLPYLSNIAANEISRLYSPASACLVFIINAGVGTLFTS